MDVNLNHPNTGFKWIILLCSFLNQMGTVGLMISLSVLYVSWLEEFREGKAMTSWILSLGCALNLAFCPVPASLAARFGFRTVGFVGALLTSAGLVASAFATSVSFAIVSVGLVSGIGCSFAYLPSVAMVAVYFEKRRSMAMGIAITGVGVGSFVLAPLLDYLEQTYTWRGALLILGGLALNMCVTALLFRPIETTSHDFTIINRQYETAKNYCREEGGEEGDTQIDHQLPQITLEEVNVSCDGNSISNDERNLKEENWCLIRDFQSHAALQKGSLNCDENKHVGDKNPPRNNNDTMSVKNTANLNMHSSLNELRPKDPDTPHASLPNLYLRQKLKRSHGSLLRSLQNVDVLVSASLRGMGRLLDQSEKEERLEYGSEMAEINQNNNQNKDTKQNKSLLSKLLSSPAVKANLDTLNDKIFILFCISNLIACLSFYTPVIFLVDRAVYQGIDKSIGAVLISANGCGNILGRISTGWLTDGCCTNRMLIFILALAAQGVGTTLSSLCGSNVILHGAYAVYLGFLMGMYTILAPLVTVDLKGVSNIATAYGLVLTFKGTGSVIGPPISGLLFDWTKSYSLSYIANGVFLLTSALILVPLLCQPYRRGPSDNN